MKQLFTLLQLLVILFCYSQNSNNFWGMTYLGGNGGGVIFKSDHNGCNVESVYNFSQFPGASPWGTLLVCPDNNLYGLTSGGGAHNLGLIFKFNLNTGIYSKEIDINEYSAGGKSYGSLCLSSNGKFFAMSNDGGIYSKGSVWVYDTLTTDQYAIVSFNVINGAYPNGDLIQANNGKLYGMTTEGGLADMGVLFEVDPVTEQFEIKVHFYNTIGSWPFASLLQASNNLLYGMTALGGDNDCGVIFEYNYVSDTYVIKHHFDGPNSGKHPMCSLIEAETGKLYGMTYEGGINNCGVIFEYDISANTLIKKHDFDSLNSGKNPYGDLFYAENEKFYGMTNLGGIFNYGIIFEWDPDSNIVEKQIDFAGTTNGRYPSASFVEPLSGKLYGLTVEGGTTIWDGVLFEYDYLIDTYTKLIDFRTSPDGCLPHGKLLHATNDQLYGVASSGGINSHGVLFSLDPQTHNYQKIIDFKDINTGASPFGNLMQADNGQIYGTTYIGGSYGLGTIFEFDPTTQTITKLYDFDNLNGSNPWGGLMQASNGKLYGMTKHSTNAGVLYEYNIASNTLTTLVNFTGPNGNSPQGNLIQVSNGNLYGMTTFGGSHNMGVIFEYNPVTGFNKLFDFSGVSTGAEPEGDLVCLYDSLLYGTTFQGGINNNGVLFKYNLLTGVFTKIIDFDYGMTGAYSSSTLLPATNGKLYGMTINMNSHKGAIFQYDPLTDEFILASLFNGINGGNPLAENSLIEIGSSSMIPALFSEKPILYPNPFHHFLNVHIPEKYQLIIVNIYNNIGSIVFSQTYNNTNHIQLNLNQPAGKYSVQIIADQTLIYSCPIIKL
jgi:uncharacterized repeat protein (TIGR03803 family)